MRASSTSKMFRSYGSSLYSPNSTASSSPSDASPVTASCSIASGSSPLHLPSPRPDTTLSARNHNYSDRQGEVSRRSLKAELTSCRLQIAALQKELEQCQLRIANLETELKEVHKHYAEKLDQKHKHYQSACHNFERTERKLTALNTILQNQLRDSQTGNLTLTHQYQLFKSVEKRRTQLHEAELTAYKQKLREAQKMIKTNQRIEDQRKAEAKKLDDERKEIIAEQRHAIDSSMEAFDKLREQFIAFQQQTTRTMHTRRSSSANIFYSPNALAFPPLDSQDPPEEPHLSRSATPGNFE